MRKRTFHFKDICCLTFLYARPVCTPMQSAYLKKLNSLYKYNHAFDKSNNTGSRMFDSIYHMALKLFCNRIFGMQTSRFYHLLGNVINRGYLLF